jgi:hypothetical protein
VRGNGFASLEISTDGFSLSIAGHFTGKEKPQKSFGERFFSTRSFGEFLAAFGNGKSTETDAFLGIKQ